MNIKQQERTVPVEPLYDAVMYEAFEEEERELKALLPKGRKYLFTWKTIQESGHKTPPGKVISVRTQSKIPVEWAPLIDGIITRSTGYDHISEYLKTCGRPLKAAYLPEYAARAVAEQAMILWSSCLRLLKTQTINFKNFHRDGLTGREIKGKTIVIAGVGRIGTQIVDIAKGLGMTPIGIDIAPNKGLEKKYGLEYLSWEEALPQADVLACALPLTSATRGLVNGKRLSSIKKGAVFVNVGRGEVSPSEDLLALLESEVLSGIGLDVYDHEKEIASVLRDGVDVSSLPEASRRGVMAIQKLMMHPRAILAPHNAFNTQESVGRKSKETAANLESYFSTGDFLTAIPLE